MLLQKLAAIDNLTLLGNADQTITGLALNSHDVKPGNLFIAVQGTATDGRAFIPDAIKQGAVAILVSDETPMDSLPSSVAILKTANVRAATSALAARFFQNQPENIIAVTGTSGKTSTALFTMGLWKALGHRAASLGTLGLITPEESHYGSLTTPDQITLYKSLADCAAQNITHLAMEASSHGIELNRLDNVKLKAAAFTNLSRDHLDYHKTVENYLNAKRRLFTTLLPDSGIAVLNADCDEYVSLRSDCDSRNLRSLSFGEKGMDIRLLSYAPQGEGQRIEIELLGKKRDIVLPVIGSFQVWNCLCALGLVIATGANPDHAFDGIQHLQTVPGRLQLIGKTAKGGIVFVDYAHKPAALENVLNGLRPHVQASGNAKLGVVFGCGGNRDAGKRPMMGEIAQRLADWSIVTDDNPRKEKADTIRAQIMAGYTDRSHASEIGDRKKAIEEGISKLGKGDILVIAGKGHEPGQIVGDQVLPFDDCEVARSCIGGRP